MPDMNEHSETQQEWLGITENKKECWKDCTEPCNTLERACLQLSQAKIIIENLLSCELVPREHLNRRSQVLLHEAEQFIKEN